MSQPADRIVAMRWCLAQGWSEDEVCKTFGVSPIFIDTVKCYEISDELPAVLVEVRDRMLSGEAPASIATAIGMSQQAIYNRIILLRLIRLLPPKGLAKSTQANRSGARAGGRPPAAPAALEENRPRHETLFEKAMQGARFKDDPREAAISRLIDPKPKRPDFTNLQTLGGVVGALS